MRKVVICLLALLLSVGVPSAVAYASVEESPLLDLLLEKPYAGGLVPEIDPDRFPEKLKDYSIEDKPILVAFHSGGWEYAAQPTLEEGIQAACRDGWIDYIVMEDEPVRFCMLANREEYHCPSFATIPAYVSDIMDGSVKQTFLGEEYTIENLICFDGASSLKGVIVYYFTDGGVFVRYYEDYTSQAVEYTYEEFQPYATAYYELTTSYEYNYNEKGEPLYGGGSFTEFMKNPDLYQRAACGAWIKAILIGVVVIGLGVGVCLYVRYRKKKSM